MPLHAILLALLVALLWGLNFAASKIALTHFPPFLLLWLRFVMVVVLLLPFTRKISTSWRQLFWLSFWMITAYFGLIFTALHLGLPIGTAIIAMQLGAPFSCLLGILLMGDKLGKWRTFGMLVAFSGVVIIAGTPQVENNWLAFFIAVISAGAWATSNIHLKRVGHVAVMPLFFWIGLLSLPQTALLSLWQESNHWTLIQTAPLDAWLGVAYTAIGSTIIAYGAWYWLMKHYEVSQVAPFSLLVPISGFASGMFFFDEPLTTQIAIGGLLTMLGVAIITFRRPRMARIAKG